MRKRILGVCVALTLAFACCTGFWTEAFAAETVMSAEQFLYQYNSGYQGIELIKYQGKDTIVNIPAEIGGVPVTAVGAGCFYRKKKLAGITMPDTVVSIGDQAFGFCSALENITWSNNLKKIGREAFIACKMRTFHMPDSLIEIGEDAFWGCHALEEVVCSKGITELNGTFGNCENLETVQMPPSSQLTRIGKETFYGCSIKEIAVPASVTEISEEAFDSSGLRKITFAADSQLKKIGSEAFAHCFLKKIVLPASLKELGDSPFADCMSLKRISFAKNAKIKKLPDNCFRYCRALTEVEIPENVTEIGNKIFGQSYEKYVRIRKIHFKGGKVRKMGEAAFYGLSTLSKVTITVPKKFKKKYTTMFQKQEWYDKSMEIKAVKKV